MIDTRRKLLDTAERLFAEQGYGAVSLRQIIADAEVNLAAIHYHFGSKQELLDEVIMRKAGPVNLERLARLGRLEAESARIPGRTGFRSVPDADGRNRRKSIPRFPKLMGRIQAEGILSEVAGA